MVHLWPRALMTSPGPSGRTSTPWARLRMLGDDDPAASQDRAQCSAFDAPVLWPLHPPAPLPFWAGSGTDIVIDPPTDFDDGQVFHALPSFGGPRPGWVYKSAFAGVGYYQDDPATVVRAWINDSAFCSDNSDGLGHLVGPDTMVQGNANGTPALISLQDLLPSVLPGHAASPGKKRHIRDSSGRSSRHPPRKAAGSSVVAPGAGPRHDTLTRLLLHTRVAEVQAKVLSKPSAPAFSRLAGTEDGLSSVCSFSAAALDDSGGVGDGPSPATPVRPCIVRAPTCLGSHARQPTRARAASSPPADLGALLRLLGQPLGCRPARPPARHKLSCRTVVHSPRSYRLGPDGGRTRRMPEGGGPWRLWEGLKGSNYPGERRRESYHPTLCRSRTFPPAESRALLRELRVLDGRLG